MGIRELYLEEQKKSSSATSKKSSTGVRALYEREKEREKMSGEIDSYFKDAQAYFKWTTEDYNSYSYDNSAAGRSKIDYYTNDLRTRGNEIRTWLDANKDTLDAKSYADIIASLDSVSSGLDSIYGEYDKKLNYISGFNSAEEYNKLPYNPQVQQAAQEYLQNSLSDGSLYKNQQGAEGWNKYLEDNKANMEAAISAQKKKSFWEKAGDVILEAAQMSAQSGDSNIPMQGMMNAQINAYRNDVSYMRPQDDWSKVQQYEFGRLYLESPEKAYAYAEETNKKNAQAKEEAARKEIQDNATSGFWAGAGNTIGAIATAPLGMADFLDDIAKISAGREITPDGNISPFEYSQAVTEGISTHLNEKGGVINENVPIIGGKGWGDVYGLGTSIAQSMASAYTLGPYGTLVSYFGQGAAAGVDDALSRGASEDQALLYGTLLGTFEGVAEMIGIENLFKLGSASTIKGVIKNILKQAGAEGMEEGLTTVLNNIADAWVMQDKSNFNKALENYMAQGMSKSEAQWKVFWDSIEGILYDAAGGAVSGGVSGGIHTGVNAIGNKIEQNAAIKEHGQAILDTSGQSGVDALRELATAQENKKLSKFAAKVEKNASAKNVGRLSARLENSVSEQNRADIVAALEAKGLSNKDAKRGAQYILSELSDEQIARLEKDKGVSDAVKALKNDESLDLGKNSTKLMAARLGIKKDLQSDTNSDIINESEEISNEGNEGTESVRLRDGSERTDGENTEGSVFDLESGTGTYQGRRKSGRVADSEAARLANEGREVSVASLGILRGSANHTVRLVDAANETATMKQARNRAEARGLKVKFFAGDNLVIADKEGKLFSARGYILGDTVLVRADHDLYTADQLMRHEIGHDMIAKGEVDVNEARERLEKVIGKENVDALADAYAYAYAGTTLTPEEIWEECICDSLGDMNIFTGNKELFDAMTYGLEGVKKATLSTAKEPNQTRGSPEGKASAEVSDKVIDLSDDNELSRIVDGVYGSAKYKKIAQYILDVLGSENIKLSDGRIAVVDKSDAMHIANKAASKKTAQIGKIKELVESAQLYAEDTAEHNKFDHFYYYRSDVKYEGETFPIYLNVGRGITDSKYHLYDITNKIRDTADRINGLERPKPNEGYALTNGISSKNSIPQKADLSTHSAKKVSEGKASRETNEIDADYNRLFEMRTEETKLRQTIKDFESSEDFKAQHDKLSDAIANDNIEKGIAAYEKWKKESGYGKLLDRKDKLKKDIDQLGKQLENERVDNELAKERAAIEKSGLSEADYFRSQAVEIFGYTPYFYDAGYILPNGKMLNFSGEKGQHFGSRGEDHRAIGQVYANTQGSDALVRFMSNGNIRIMAESPGIDLTTAVEPTVSQYNTISRFIANSKSKRYFFVDFTDEKGHVVGTNEYEGNVSAEEVLYDIKQYYKTGETRERSEYFSRELDTDKVFGKIALREYSLQEISSLFRQSRPTIEYSGLFSKAYDYCEKAGVTFEFVPEIINKEGKQVFGRSQGNKIIFSQKLFNQPNITNQRKAKTILHEMLHSTTVYAMDEYKNAIKGGATTKLSKNVYNSCKEIYRVYASIRNNSLFKDEYGIKNAREMVAELSNPEFASKLKGSYPTPWHKLLEAICEIFGINKTFTNYDKLTKAVDEILTHPDYALSKQYDSLVSKNPLYLDDSQYYDHSTAKDGKASRELDVIDYMNEQAEREGRGLAQPMSNREILANALESSAQHEVEKKRLAEYKAKIKDLDAEQEKLKTLKAEIKELTFGKEKKDPAKLKALREEAVKTENRIKYYDKKLLELEAMTAIKNVLEVEKRRSFKSAMSKAREIMHEGVQGRNKTSERNKIKRVAHELDALLNRGTKERNVKKGLAPIVRSALDISNMLFATDDELLLAGIGTEYTDTEKAAMDKYMELYEEYHSYDDAVTENKEKRKELRSEMNEVKKGFEDVLERERKRIGALKAKGAFDALIEEYGKLANSDEGYIRQVFDTDTLEHIKKLKEDVGETLIKDMTLEQLKKVYQAYRMVQKMVTNANRAFASDIKESIVQMGEAAQSEVESHGEKGKETIKALKGLKALGWNNLKPIYLMERTGSKTLQKLFQKILDAESQWAIYTREAQEYIAEQKKKYGYKKWDFDKSKSFTDPAGREYTLTLSQMMTVYAYSKRGEQAVEHLRNDGFVFDKIIVKKKGIKYEIANKTAYKISDSILLEIINGLTEDQKAYVDAMQKYLSDTLGKRGNVVSNKLYGIDLFNEENYLPIRSERAYLERARDKDKGVSKIKNRGFTKPTQKNARNAIVLEDFNKLCAEHIVEMNEYAAFTLPLEDFYRVYNYQNIADDNTGKKVVIPALMNAYGEESTKAIDRLLEDLNGSARTDYLEGFGKKAVGLFKKAKVMLSLSVVVQQPTSILRAQAFINPKYFAGKKLDKARHKAAWEELKKYAPVAIIKEMGYFDIGMGRSTVDWLLGDKTFMDRVDEVTSRGAAYADEVAWISIWNAVKRETLHNNPTMSPKSEEFLNIAGKRFEDIIRHTQVYDSTLSRSANMRSKSLFMKMTTAFMAEPTTAINMREMALRSKDKARIARVTYAIYTTAIVNALCVALIYAMRDDDEDETFIEKYTSALISSFVDNVNPMNAIPFFKDIWSAANGFSIERTDMSLFEDIFASTQKLVQLYATDNRDKNQIGKAWVNLIGDLANLTGIPAKNLYREINGFVNTYKTVKRDIYDRDTSLGSLGDAVFETVKGEVPVWGWLPNDSKTDKLYDAIIKGDKAYEDRIKSTYDTDAKYQNAVRKALKENDPRITVAAQALIDGNYKEYSDLIEDIVAEGHFTEKDVKAAIESKRNAMDETEEEKEETVEKEESIFETEYYYNALVSGDTEYAEVMREDIINAHIANGKDEEEAQNAFESSFRSYVGKMYRDGGPSREDAEDLLINYCGRDENEAYWDIRRWDYVKENGTEDGYSMYNDFNEAVRTGKNLKAVIKEYTSHGKDNKTLGDQITSYYKPLYKEMTNRERANIKGYLLNAYVLLGYDRSKKMKDIDKWLED